MFKKSFIITGLFLLVSLCSSAQEWAELAKAELTQEAFGVSSVRRAASSMSLFDNLSLQVRLIDPSIPTRGIKRSPAKAPSLSIFDHTLYFATSCDGCILRLINEDGDVEYAIEIPENTSTITLPFYLYGEYELQILRGNYCFFGFVEL
ncbi:hypothetical protein L6466_11815 [Prevotella communis]|uniref:hypothetical protein n=1 Tax=Prevotella communis TaxID=2913614 RepID=UPI001EDC36F3|nr:hypothetical protein [Prevotella communis]UKK67866.1 hypothetical protein L6464_00665 [Prevotella communis]UKK69998.1 hypothetical protein L6466_11815 [Prevotella communis]